MLTELESDEADQQLVLEEEIDENYEPTQSEILEYAKWLGMDLDNERELLWIAREGLKAPLPADWKPCQAPSREIYYFNFTTGESIWDHPCDEHFRTLYQREKARLLERRGLDGQQPHQHEPQGQQQQLQQPYQQQQQPAAASTVPALQLPTSDAVSQTHVEPVQIPQSSPSGTLSTIPSATTGSVGGSPLGALGQQTTRSIFRESSHHQDCSVPGRLSTASSLAQAENGNHTAIAAAASTAGDRAVSDGVAAAAAATAAADRWQTAADETDQEHRQSYRSHLEEQRRLWEHQLQSGLELQRAALQEQHRQHLWSLTQQLEEQERLAAAQLKAAQDAKLQALRAELQATVSRMEQELLEAKGRHMAHMANLKSQHAEMEGQANGMLHQAQLRLSHSTLTDSELSAARDKAAAAAELDALAEAAGKRAELLKAAMQHVEQEVAAEVAEYKASRRAEAFKQLAGHLNTDTAAAVEKLEKHTAELQQLEEAVADKAAVLQKLEDELEAKQQQQKQLDGSSNIAGRCSDGQHSASCKEQLGALQQQLAQAKKQLAAVDTAVLEKRAVVAEAEEQLASTRRELSVCEPRLSSLRQQVQELESTVRAREAEHQQRLADVQLANRRLHELREDVSRRQSQLESLEALYSERQESLRQATSELAWRRGELSTLESSLSESLRRKTDAEYQALEEQLRRTRKAASDAAAELSSKQLSLAEVSTQLSAKQSQLGGVDASLAAKNKELQEVLGQLQAAAVQEFQDAKNLLLEEEARLLESERRSMHVRVSDQIESERRAALTTGRRRIEREVAAQMAEERSVALAQQQKQVKRWLDAASGEQRQLTGNSLAAAASPGANGISVSSGLGVAAVLCQEASHQQQVQKQQTQPGNSNPEADDAIEADMPSPTSQAALIDSSRHRAKSLSPVRQNITSAASDGQEARAAGATVAGLGAAAAAGLDATAAAILGHLQEMGGQATLRLGAAVSSSWAAGLSDLSPSPRAGHLRSFKAGNSQGLDTYSWLLQHAKQFIKQRRRDIQQRQDTIMAAQADWKAVLTAMEEQQRVQQQAGSPESPELTQAVQQLRQLKGVLQDQIHLLNDETRRVKALKAHVQQLKTSLGVLDKMQHEQQDPASSLSSLVSALSAPHQPPRQQQEEQQQQRHRLRQRSTGVTSSPWAPVPPLKQQWQQAVQSSLQQESSLDKVTAALQAALDAASSWQDAGSIQQPASAATGRNRNGSRQPLQQGALQAQSGRSVQPAVEGSLKALDKWCEERGAAHDLMKQHSQWLQNFREQVARVTVLQPAVAAQLQAHRLSTAGAAADAGPTSSVGGAGSGQPRLSPGTLSPVPSSSLVAMPSAGDLSSGQPVTVGLGNDQELVISVVHKNSAS